MIGLVARWGGLGVALSGATVAALALRTDALAPPGWAIVGLVMLAIAGGCTPGKLARGIALAMPGAALVGFAGHLDRPGWMATAAAAAIVVAAPLVADAAARWVCWDAGPLAFAISALGVYGCVPDTEEALVLLVVALGAAVVSCLPRFRRLGAAGATACVGVLVWIAALDARGRPSAFVGAVTALGLLLWEPLGVYVRAWTGRRPRVSGRGAQVVIIVGHAALAAYASRVVGLTHAVGTALVLAVPGALVGIAIGFVAGIEPGEGMRARATS
jgi:hypothetical protein